MFADSGNGWHLIYRIDADCGPLVPELLKSLAHDYSNEQVEIDTAVGNPARLTKVYGTMTRKGDSTAAPASSICRKGVRNEHSY